MSMTPDQYRVQFEQLLPPGLALNPDLGSDLDDFMEGTAQEFGRFDARCDALQNELDPRTTVEMLTDWERVLGLPDACTGPGGTLAQRQRACVQRLLGNGGPSIPNIVAAALILGYVVTVNGFTTYDVNSPCTKNICNEQWRFAWQVNAPSTTETYSTCMSFCTDPLAVWGNTYIQCEIANYNPAHNVLIFSYS
jgi:uncharacterized protein YmfQ (DUF2313 family)